MRSDMVPGAIFPDYELSDHMAKRRKLSELQGHHQWFSSSAAEVTAPKTAGRRKGLLHSIVSSRLPIAGLSRLARTISLRRVNIAAESVPIGLSSPTRGVSSKKISTSPNTLILSTIQ